MTVKEEAQNFFKSRIGVYMGPLGASRWNSLELLFNQLISQVLVQLESV